MRCQTSVLEIQFRERKLLSFNLSMLCGSRKESVFGGMLRDRGEKPCHGCHAVLMISLWCLSNLNGSS